MTTPTVDAQKEALFAEITRRAGLYAQMLTLQRNGAPAEQIDAAIAAIGVAESEIRRMSDEINNTIWYQNYGKILDGYGVAVDLLREQGTDRQRESGEIKELLEGNSQEIKKLTSELVSYGTRLVAVVDRVDAFEETVQDHGATIADHAQRIGQIETNVDHLRTEVRERFEEIEREITALAAQQAIFQKWRDANPQPAALKKQTDAE